MSDGIKDSCKFEGSYEFIRKHIEKVAAIAIRNDGSVGIVIEPGRRFVQYKSIAEAEEKLKGMNL